MSWKSIYKWYLSKLLHEAIFVEILVGVCSFEKKQRINVPSHS